MLFLASLFQHLSRLVVHLLSFGWSVFYTSTGVLLDDKARDRSDVAIVLLENFWISRILTSCFFRNYNKLFRFPRRYKFNHRCLPEFFAKFEDLCVVHIGK